MKIYMKKIWFLALVIVCVNLTNCGKIKIPGLQSSDSEIISEENTEVVADNQPDENLNLPVEKLRVTNIQDGAKVLDNQGTNSYHAENLFDDNPATGWAINLGSTPAESDMIYGPSMNIGARKVDFIKIRNGYGKNQDSFLKNTRAKWIEIYRESASEFPEDEDILYAGYLKDTMDPQTLKINPNYDNRRPTGQVQIRVKAYIPGYDNDGYYMGSKWDDLVISELEFFGVPLNR